MKTKKINVEIGNKINRVDNKVTYKAIKELDSAIWINRDAYCMTVVDTEIYRDILACYVESGEDAAFRLLLAELNGMGYPLDHSLLMLILDSVDIESSEKNTEIRFNCLYPVNMNCRVDGNGRSVLDKQQDDGTYDKSFKVIVKEGAD